VVGPGPPEARGPSDRQLYTKLHSEMEFEHHRAAAGADRRTA